MLLFEFSFNFQNFGIKILFYQIFWQSTEKLSQKISQIRPCRAGYKIDCWIGNNTKNKMSKSQNNEKLSCSVIIFRQIIPNSANKRFKIQNHSSYFIFQQFHHNDLNFFLKFFQRAMINIHLNFFLKIFQRAMINIQLNLENTLFDFEWHMFWCFENRQLIWTFIFYVHANDCSEDKSFIFFT